MSIANIHQVEAMALRLEPPERAELVRRLIGTTPEDKGCRPSLRDHHPAFVGRVLKPLQPGDNLLDEMSRA